MPKSQRIKVTLSLEEDALDLLNKAVTLRKRGWFVSALLRQTLAQEKTVTISDVIATLRAYEGALLAAQDGGGQHRGPTEQDQSLWNRMLNRGPTRDDGSRGG